MIKNKLMETVFILWIWTTMTITCCEGAGAIQYSFPSFTTFDPCFFWKRSVHAGGGVCFKLFETAETFHAAQLACEAEFGSSLAEPRSLWQRNTVARMTNSTVWLGATVQDSGPGFRWLSDGHPVNASQAWWTNDIVGHCGSSSMCLTKSNTSRLLAERCDSVELRYICQKVVENPCLYFLPGGELFGHYCLLPGRRSLSRSDATACCGALNAVLMEPTTLEYIEFLSDFVTYYFAPGNSVWTNIEAEYNAVSSAADLSWTSSSQEVSDQLGFKIKTPHPNSASGMYSVILMIDDVKQLNVTSDMTQAFYICQKDLTNECSGVFVSGRCLYLPNFIAPWAEAAEVCESQEAFLVEPKEEIMNAALENLLEWHKVWPYIGGSDQDQNGQFEWRYSGLPLNETFTYWGVEEPNNNGGNEYCLDFIPTYGWNDMDCSWVYPFVCEKGFTADGFSLQSHKYMVALPDPATSHDDVYVWNRLIATSLANHDLFTHLKFTDIPVWSVDEVTLNFDDSFEYTVSDIDVVLSRGSDHQQRYVLVESSCPIHVHLHQWSNDLTAFEVTYMYPQFTTEVGYVFFVPPDHNRINLGVTSLTENSTTVLVNLCSTDSETGASLKDFHVQSISAVDTSTIFTKQYQSIQINSETNLGRAPFISATAPVTVYYSTEMTPDKDMAFLQPLPIHYLGSEYITIPSLPLDEGSADRFTIVAAYNETTVYLYSLNPVQPEVIYLSHPGDSHESTLPSTGFYTINGSKPFYVYSTYEIQGLCALSLMPQKIHRQEYRFEVTSPLKMMDTVWLVVTLRTEDVSNLELSLYNGTDKRSPHQCLSAIGSAWSGCYYNFTNTNDIYRVRLLDSSHHFAAYIMAMKTGVMSCFHLAAEMVDPNFLGFNLQAYRSSLQMNNSCTRDTFTTMASPTTADATTAPTTNSIETTVQTYATNNCPAASSVNLTIKEAHNLADEISRELLLNSRELSAFRRTKESARDSRNSSKAFGTLGFVMITVTLGAILIFDFTRKFRIQKPVKSFSKGRDLPNSSKTFAKNS